MTINQCIEQRVQRGVKLLDEYDPDWFKQINLEKLDLSNCHECLLGQLFKSFGHGVDIFFKEVEDSVEYPMYNGEYRESVEHGFAGYVRDACDVPLMRYYQYLTDAWKQVIIERQVNIQHAEIGELELVS